MFQQSATQEDIDRIEAVTGQASGSVVTSTAARDPFIDHYFRRIDPQIAASFTTEQREAIKSMFGARGIAKHSVEIRRSVPVGRRRYYFVLLLGPERRTMGRLFSEGAATRPFTLLGYAITAAAWLLPAAGGAILLQAIL